MTIVSNKVEEITRKNWIDWMKVIGITAVVWGHFFPEGMSDFIYAFNVPVFFVISGYLTKENRGMRENAKKVAVGLAVPYILLALLKVAGFVFKHITDGKALWSLLYVVTGVHDYNGISGCNNLWFVYTLIIIKLFFPIIRKQRILIAVLAVVSLVCGKLYSDLDVDIPWAVPDVMLAFPFFALGYLIRVHNPKSNVQKNYNRHSILLSAIGVILLVAITYFASSYNGEVHLFSGHYGNNIFLFVLAALSGTAMVYLLSKLLDSVRWHGLRIISSGTIVILTFHREFIHPLSKMFDKLDMSLIMQNVAIFLSSVVIVLVFIPIIMLLERYAPILLGKRK